MNHEDALMYALAGGPAPQEAAAHLGSCPSCAAELAALREVEALLKAAAPASGSACPVSVRLTHPANGNRRIWAAAAAACMGVAFAASWWGMRAPGPRAPAPLSPSPVQISFSTAVADESLASVLDAVQVRLDEEGTTGADAAGDYFADPLQGGVL